jgi:hypothetical protein
LRETADLLDAHGYSDCSPKIEEAIAEASYLREYNESLVNTIHSLLDRLGHCRAPPRTSIRGSAQSTITLWKSAYCLPRSRVPLFA